MPLFRSSKVIERQIDEFLDTINEGVLVFRDAIKSYLANDLTEFEARIGQIDRLEAKADKLSQEVEAELYSHSLIPEHRGDVLGLLEHSDDIIDTVKTSIYQFSVERPEIPSELDTEFIKLADASYLAAEAAVIALRAFFRDVQTVSDHLFKVHHYEKEADIVSDQLKRHIFSMAELDLAQKIHLRYFALNVEKVSDMAEDVADRLAIYAIKQQM